MKSNKSSPKKIILHVIPSLNIGGAETALFRLVECDNRNKHIVIAMMSEGHYSSKLVELGAEVYYLNMPRGKATVSGLLELWRLLRSLQPDVVQTWMYHADLIGGIFARLAGVGKVFWGIRHSDLSREKNSYSTLLVAKLCALFSFVVPNKIICCAERAANIHKAFGYSKKRFVVIPNGYDFKSLVSGANENQAVRDQLCLSNEVSILGMVARFDLQKDHENLISALGMIKRNGFSFQCLLIGLGMDDFNISIEKWLIQYDVVKEVQLLGVRNDIPAIMSCLDLHVLSSIGEGFPNVVAEAMMHGVPCVSTDVGDAGLIVGDAGWIVPPANSKALASAIMIALTEMKNNDQWGVRKKMAKERVFENFSIEKMMVSYHKVWGCK